MLIYFTLSNRQNIHILPQQSNRHATPPLLSLPPIAKLSSFSLLPTSLLSILPFICFCPLPLTPQMYSRWVTLTNSIALCLVWFCFTLTLGSYSYLLFFSHLFFFHLQLQPMELEIPVLRQVVNVVSSLN